MRRLFAYFVIYFVWGGSYLAIRQAVSVAPPYFAAGIRFLLAGILLLAYVRCRGFPAPQKEHWANSALLGLVMFAGNYGCLFWSQKYLPSGLAAVLSALIPVWVLLADWLIAHAPAPTPKAILGILLGVTGVFLIALPSGVPGTSTTKAAFILVMGNLFWAWGTIAGRRFRLPKQTMMSAGMQMAWGGLFLLMFSAANHEFSKLPSLWRLWDWRFALSMGYLILIASIVSFTAYIWLLAHEPATRVASYAYVNPVVALALGAIFAHERPTLVEYAGTLLVLAAVCVTLAARSSARQVSVEVS